MSNNPVGPAHHLAPALRSDPQLLSRVEQIAHTILRRLGDDPSRSARTNGWVNPGWMTDRHVIRVSLTPGRGDIRREAAVARHLPPDVGYPHVVEAGELDQHEYLVTRRIDADNLRQAWLHLEHDVRAGAIRALWTRAEAVHAVETETLSGVDLHASPFIPPTVGDAVTWLDHLAGASILTSGAHRVLAGRVAAFYTALAKAPAVLCHGDLYTGNALWDGHEVVGLVDFEFAVIGPPEIDLNELTKIAFAHRIVDDAGTHIDPVEQAVIDIARSLPADPELLTGCAILLEAFLTAQELTHRDAAEVLDSNSARLLDALGRPDGGHLARLIS